MPAPTTRPACLVLVVAAALGCEFGPLEPGQPFTPGVYHLHVSVEDGCGQIDLPATPSLDCRGGLWSDPDAGESLVAFWPEIVAQTYVLHDGALPQVATMPVLRWSTSGLEQPMVCELAERRWVLSLSNDDLGLVSGSLRNTWSHVETCPVTTVIPQQDCVTRFTYRYELETACASPCELVEADEQPEIGELRDCGASVCECP